MSLLAPSAILIPAHATVCLTGLMNLQKSGARLVSRPTPGPLQILTSKTRFQEVCTIRFFQKTEHTMADAISCFLTGTSQWKSRGLKVKVCAPQLDVLADYMLLFAPEHRRCHSLTKMFSYSIDFGRQSIFAPSAGP